MLDNRKPEYLPPQGHTHTPELVAEMRLSEAGHGRDRCGGFENFWGDGTKEKVEETQAVTSHPALRDSTRNVGEGNFRGLGKAETWEA